MSVLQECYNPLLNSIATDKGTFTCTAIFETIHKMLYYTSVLILVNYRINALCTETTTKEV